MWKATGSGLWGERAVGRQGPPGAREPPSGRLAARDRAGRRSRAAPGCAGQPEPVRRQGCHAGPQRALPWVGPCPGAWPEQTCWALLGQRPPTRVMSREAAAALMCRLGCRTELLQSRARAKVPTELGGGAGRGRDADRWSRQAGGQAGHARHAEGPRLGCLGEERSALELGDSACLRRALVPRQPLGSSAGWRPARGGVGGSMWPQCSPELPSGGQGGSLSRGARVQEAWALATSAPAASARFWSWRGTLSHRAVCRKSPGMLGGPEQPLRASSARRKGQASLGTTKGS